MCENCECPENEMDPEAYANLLLEYPAMNADETISIEHDGMLIPALVVPNLPYPREHDIDIGHTLRVHLARGSSLTRTNLFLTVTHDDEENTTFKFRLPLSHETMIFMISVITVGKWALIGADECAKEKPFYKELGVTAELVEGAGILSMSYHVLARMGLLQEVINEKGDSFIIVNEYIDPRLINPVFVSKTKVKA